MFNFACYNSITSWGKAAKTIIQPIINTQKRIIKIMTGSNCQTNSSPLFTKLKTVKWLVGQLLIIS